MSKKWSVIFLTLHKIWKYIFILKIRYVHFINTNSIISKRLLFLK